jgi:hypothetical protein
MAAARPRPVSTIEALKLCKFLASKKYGRTYDRNGSKRDVRYYAALRVEDADSGVIVGHVCDRKGFEVEFRCAPAGRLSGLNPISVTPGQKGWGGMFANAERAVTLVESILWKAINKSKVVGQKAFYNSKMDGFYLKLTRKNGLVSDAGRDCLQKAVDDRYITKAFRNTCIDWRISMWEAVAVAKKAS